MKSQINRKLFEYFILIPFPLTNSKTYCDPFSVFIIYLFVLSRFMNLLDFILSTKGYRLKKKLLAVEKMAFSGGLFSPLKGSYTQFLVAKFFFPLLKWAKPLECQLRAENNRFSGVKTFYCKMGLLAAGKKGPLKAIFSAAESHFLRSMWHAC